MPWPAKVAETANHKFLCVLESCSRGWVLTQEEKFPLTGGIKKKRSLHQWRAHTFSSGSLREIILFSINWWGSLDQLKFVSRLSGAVSSPIILRRNATSRGAASGCGAKLQPVLWYHEQQISRVDQVLSIGLQQKHFDDVSGPSSAFSLKLLLDLLKFFTFLQLRKSSLSMDDSLMTAFSFSQCCVIVTELSVKLWDFNRYGHRCGDS